jgi:hypothetical protein
MKLAGFIVGMLMSASATSHEFTPTYFDFKPSFNEGAVVTTMKLFNKRSDINFYEIEVYDENFVKLPFATSTKIIKLRYLESRSVDVYVKKQDEKKVVYICSVSKIEKQKISSTLVSSRVCSKMK